MLEKGVRSYSTLYNGGCQISKEKTLVKAIHENVLRDLGLGRSTTVVGISILGA